MAPVPENNTNTLFVDYAFFGQQRSFQLRTADNNGPEIPTQVAENFLNALEALRPPSWQVTGARWRARQSTISLPIEPPVITTGTFPDSDQPVTYPRFVSWIGRGPVSGRRVRVTLYGLQFSVPSDYRFEAGDNAALDAARTALDSANPGSVITIVGDDPLWYLYYNVGFNSYYERKQRRSG